LIYLPNKMSKAINSAFDPPAKYSSSEGAYIVDCDATPPDFGVKIGNTTFWINPLDMILDDGTGTDTCITGIVDSDGTISILGDVFMK
jgi:hypothetical protein